MNAVEGAADKYTALILGMKCQLAGNASAIHVISVIGSTTEESKGSVCRFHPNSVVACSEDSAAFENAQQRCFATPMPPPVSTLTSS